MSASNFYGLLLPGPRRVLAVAGGQPEGLTAGDLGDYRLALSMAPASASMSELSL